ncbi:hypothetical protein EKO04_010548 [Ascochyta lentis]|uniref:Uncharacterized protein n=1 Tax=Ascochyta lentis TaxID=205686 RepID=A0A8H7IWJ3_9PLEO|nr:hypothetical protein EKO04_010548 [Ascochyta lentis]
MARKKKNNVSGQKPGNNSKKPADSGDVSEKPSSIDKRHEKREKGRQKRREKGIVKKPWHELSQQDREKITASRMRWSQLEKAKKEEAKKEKRMAREAKASDKAFDKITRIQKHAVEVYRRRHNTVIEDVHLDNRVQDEAWVYEREIIIADLCAQGLIRSTGHGSTAGLEWPDAVFSELKELYETATFKVTNAIHDDVAPGTIAAMPPILAKYYPYYHEDDDIDNACTFHQEDHVVA